MLLAFLKISRTERVMGLEPTISCLGSKRSTTELHPHNKAGLASFSLAFDRQKPPGKRSFYCVKKA